MPKDSATDFQQPGMQVVNNPVKGGDLGGSHLFGGSAQIWAGIGKTALDAASQFSQTAQMLQQSPANPAVQAQMKEAQDRANLGRDTITYARQHPSYGRAITGETPQGATMTAPATLPVSQSTNWDLDQDGNNPPQQPPPAPSTEPKTTTEPKKTDAPKPKSHQEQMSQVSPSQSSSFAGPNQADTDAAIREGLSRNQFASNEPGIPADYQPPQQPGGSIWSPMRPAPMAPPAPVAQGQPPAPQADPVAVQQAKQKQDQDLANWQNQTQTEPMTAQDAMNWMKRKTTLAQDATYLPHGGPNGEPAYAFHMKGGGVNTVPIGQMVKDGGGPVVAAQNTSQVLSQSDRLQQQQNQPQPQPSPVWNPMQPAPGPTAAPAAPTGPQDQGAMGGTPGPYPNLSGPPPAPGVGVYGNIQQQNQPTFPGPVAPGPQQPLGQEQPAAAAPETPPARIQAETRSANPQTAQVQTPPEQVTELNADADAAKSRRTWQTDSSDASKGTVRFTTKQSPRAGFYEQRFYRGSPGWEDGLWTPENVKRQEVLDTYGSASSNIPRGQVLDYDQVKKMLMPELDAQLAEAVWWKSHPTGAPPEQPLQQRLNAEANASRYFQTLIDMSQWAKDKKQNPSTYSEKEILQATEAGLRDGVMSQNDANDLLNDLLLFPKKGQQNEGMPKAMENPWDLAQYSYHDLFAGYKPKNPFAFAVGSKIKDLTSTLEQLPEYKGRAIADEDWPVHHAGINIPDWHINLGLPVSSDPSRIPEINSLVQGTSHDEAIRNYTQAKSRVDAQYVKDVKNAAYAGIRVSDDDMDNMKALSKPNGAIKDSNNPMRDKDGKLINPYAPQPGQTSASSASPTPRTVPQQEADAAPHPKTQADYDAIKSGTLYWDLDGQLKPKP